MRLITIDKAGERRLCVDCGEEVVDLLAVLVAKHDQRSCFEDARAFIAAGEQARALAQQAIDSPPPSACFSRREVRLLAPMLPSTILAAGSNYRAHNEEKLNTALSGKEPEFFVMTADCVIGPDEAIQLDRRLTQKLDAETELGIVVGRSGRHIKAEDALDHVFGYTIINDVTARDRQVRRTPEGFVWYELGRSKAFDGSAPLGPCIVTADEIPDPQDLVVTTRINGEVRQLASTRDMIWTCAELISFFSANFTLRPGMVISTGTPSGTAWSMDKELGGTGRRTPGTVPATRYCLPGDVVESEIERIGVLRNPIA